MKTSPYIAIEGVIGVGKTTLARILQDVFQAQILLEIFEENPFLSKFYEDPERYAFQAQIFFLLSRYRQQNEGVSRWINRQAIISDYLFAKDQLFARLNLSGDELNVYQNVYSTLSERVQKPDLVVYLQANVDTLMARIAIRDRPYERNMSRAYISRVHQAYEQFFEGYQQSPVITIPTNQSDIVRDMSARQAVIGQIKAALNQGVSQPHLPYLDIAHLESHSEVEAKRLPNFQKFHQKFDQAKNFPSDLYFNYIKLVEEIGELGQVVAQVWHTQQLQQNQSEAKAAFETALQAHRSVLQSELADCLAYLLKLANYTGINLEQAYLDKMAINLGRNWPHFSQEDTNG